MVLVYGKKYPLNSDDLRETQIFMTNPNLEKVVQKRMEKEGKVMLLKGDLSVIMEETEKYSSVISSHVMEGDN